MKDLKVGSKKIKITDYKLYEKKKLFWKEYSDISELQKEIIDLFLKNKNHNLILEKNKINFVKGHLDRNNNISGERIKHIPNGEKLARGGYSIFAKHLTINNDFSNFKWAVSYQNSSGTRTYLYLEKDIELEQKEKYKLVKKFKKNYKKIMKNLNFDLKKNNDLKYLALFFLIKTNIRVGNYEYFKKFNHKGLTTLQKNDIKIKSPNIVSFEFIGKDGIPQNIEKKIDEFYINLLKKRLNSIKGNNFVFADNLNFPIHSKEFSDILFKYTGIHFYPHIIRSYYADIEVEKFLKKNKGKEVTKKQIEEKLLEIASNLGHKKYNKKDKIYEPNFKITIENYIYPELVKKIYDLIKTK